MNGKRPPPSPAPPQRRAEREALSTADLEDYAGREPERTIMAVAPGPPPPPPAAVAAPAVRRATGEQQRLSPVPAAAARPAERPPQARRITSEITAPVRAATAPPDATDEMTDQLRVPSSPPVGGADMRPPPPASGGTPPRPTRANAAAAGIHLAPWRDDVNDAPTGVHALGVGRGESVADPNDAPTGVRPFPSEPPVASAPVDVNEMPTSVRPAPVGPPAPPPAPEPMAASAGPGEAAETTKPTAAVKAGAWSRRHSKPEVAATQPVASESQPAEVPAPVDPAVRRRLVIIGSIAGGLVLALIGWAIFFMPPDQPTTQELQVLYPYGFEGAVGPRGERAPGALQVAITYQKRVACTRHSDDLDCLLYQYSAGEFSGTMVVQKVGRFWIRTSDDGMPFRPQR